MKQILLIEPDRPLAKLYKSALKNAGYEVRSATNSQQAIYMADSNKPDAIILELQLVGHSGIEFMYELRSYEDWQTIPVLLNTTVPYYELSDSWELLSSHLGVSEYNYKPHTSLSNLVSNVNQLVKA